MTTVAITAPTGCASINTAGLMDALRKTDRAWRMTRDPDAQAIFEVRLVGLDDRPIACRDGVVMHPDVAADQLDPPDLVMVPGLDDDLEPSFQRNRTWVPWIAKGHAAGARVASSCTGAFLAAAAGVLDGKEATTHWIAADAFRRRFPRVLLRPGRMIVDAGDVISSGGATTFLTLVIYLTERYGSHDRAVRASKVMLIGTRQCQHPHARPSLQDRHWRDAPRLPSKNSYRGSQATARNQHRPRRPHQGPSRLRRPDGVPTRVHPGNRVQSSTVQAQVRPPRRRT
jgi:transcriptional regulator GlxA family with amidase domain